MTEAKEFLWRDYSVDECMACARGMPNDDDMIRAKLGWKMADEIERLRGLLEDALFAYAPGGKGEHHPVWIEIGLELRKGQRTMLDPESPVVTTDQPSG